MLFYVDIDSTSVQWLNAFFPRSFFFENDNGFSYSLWETNDWITLLYNDFSGFAVKLLTWAVMIFAFGLVAYYIYMLLLMFVVKCKWLFIKSK